MRAGRASAAQGGEQRLTVGVDRPHAVVAEEAGNTRFITWRFSST